MTYFLALGLTAPLFGHIHDPTSFWFYDFYSLKILSFCGLPVRKVRSEIIYPINRWYKNSTSKFSCFSYVLRDCINYQYFTLRVILWGHTCPLKPIIIFSRYVKFQEIFKHRTDFRSQDIPG